MIATLVKPAERGPQTTRNPRTARGAAQRRISRKDRARYVALFRFCGVLMVALCLVMTYVMLTARLTSLNYAVGRAQRERIALLADSARLDDRLAVLRSDDRLAWVAARLRMQDPQQFAIVTMPPQVRRPEPSHLAFLAGLASIFGAK
ncbi:MAG TPA: hypothetical protein VFE17_10895 [Candidatus Baltobacteraceae bacterium]|jgi:hypothetical protein|nr:hypothetical protein [Candidatus Baltobacteraceae bacterium]